MASTKLKLNQIETISAYSLIGNSSSSASTPIAFNLGPGLTFTGGTLDVNNAASLQKGSVRASTTAALTAATRNIQSFTITGASLTLDDTSVANDDLVLVRHGVSGVGVGAADNGVYKVSGVGGSSVTLTRVYWMNTAAQIDGIYVVIEDGTLYKGTLWLTFSEVTTLGTDVIAFTQIATSGTGISSLGGLSDATHAFGNGTGAAGTQPAWSSAAAGGIATHTLNIPDASATTSTRGLMTATQFTAVLGNKAQNLIYAGPNSGADAAPTFRSLIAADLNTVTVPVANGGTSYSSYTAGDILYASNTAVLSKLAISGSTGKVLVSTGSAPSWGTVSLASGSAGITGVLSLPNGGTGASAAIIQGGIIYAASATGYASTVAGTSGQILQSNAASAPTWVDKPKITKAYFGAWSTGSNNSWLLASSADVRLGDFTTTAAFAIPANLDNFFAVRNGMDLTKGVDYNLTSTTFSLVSGVPVFDPATETMMIYKYE